MTNQQPLGDLISGLHSLGFNIYSTISKEYLSITIYSPYTNSYIYHRIKGEYNIEAEFNQVALLALKTISGIK